MNISLLSLFWSSVIVIVYVPVSIPCGITQGTENVPSEVIGVSNVSTITPSWSVTSICRRLVSDFATPLIATVCPVRNSVFSSVSVIPFSVGTDTLMSILFVSRRLCAVFSRHQNLH